ncbi:hypothetical protein C1H70_11570, partial [Halomonas urumqiensis]
MTIATVVSITGQAWARDAEGNLRELRVGSTLEEGETLLTADNATVELEFADGLPPSVVEGGQVVTMTAELDAEQPVESGEFSALDEDLDTLLTALEGEGDLLDVLDATAAGAGGAGGGGEGGGHSFVMLGRISEATNPQAYSYDAGSLSGVGVGASEETQLPEEDAPTATVEFELFEGVANVSGGTIVEGSPFQLIATVDTPPVGSPLVISLSNGQQIIIPVGETTGEVLVETRVDDPYVQGSEDIPITVVGTEGGDYEELIVLDIPPITVVDDDDVTTVALDGPQDVPELTEITLTANVDNPPQTDLTLELSNGEVITILAGQSSGSVTFNAPNVPDGGGEVSVTIVGAEGGNYEALDISGAEHTTGVIDRVPSAGETANVLDDAAIPSGDAIVTGTLPLGFGGDGAGGVGLQAMDGQTATLGTESVSYAWDNSTSTLLATGPRGDLFSVVVDPQTGGYTATLLDNVLHTEGADDDGLSLTFTVTDADGSSVNGQVTLNFLDDAPTAADDTITQAAENAPVLVDVLANDEVGADGVDLTTGVAVVAGSLTGSGDLVYNDNGTFTYTPAPGEEGDVSFQYTLTDGDGDTSTATATLTLQDDSTPTISVVRADG